MDEHPLNIYADCGILIIVYMFLLKEIQSNIDKVMRIRNAVVNYRVKNTYAIKLA